jgi:Co/Zn/Cd efflux system component
MTRTVFEVKDMDCAAEEQLIRMQLDRLPAVKGLQFDLAARRLVVLHEGDPAEIDRSLAALQLDSSLLLSGETGEELPAAESGERRMFVIVLAINFLFFLLEAGFGYLNHSMGLVADSLDMLADALVYGLSLYAVNKAVRTKKHVARSCGYLQLGLAVLGLAEVIRRFAGYGEQPVFQVMIGLSALALAANGFTLYLLQKARNQEVHVKASQICTSNDVLVNAGVIVAGVLVYATQSRLPDLVIGVLIFVLVGKASFRILQLSR